MVSAAENLGKLIDLYQAKAPDAQFVVIGPTQSFPELLTKRLLAAHYGKDTPANLRAVCAGFQSVATRRGFKFIDLSKVPSSAGNSIDGIHPNAAGHEELFEAIWSSLSAAGPSTNPS